MKSNRNSVFNIAVVSLKNIAHIHHVIPIAYELAREKNVNVDIFTDTTESMRIIEQIGKHYASRCDIVQLFPGRLHRLNNWIAGSPARAKHVLYNNRGTFKQYDCIISPDLYTNTLFHEVDRKKTKFVFAFHGAGEGHYAYKKEITEYDLLLLSSTAQKQRFVEKFDLPSEKLAVCGYVKFDLVPDSVSGKPFDNNKKTVLYTPHFRTGSTSWYDWGLDILGYFYRSEHFNLIFAPHILLGKKKRVRKSIPATFFSSKNILIDFGSIKSIDMSHCLAADIYLGDISSQLYEFIYTPRPCVFLNNKQIAWKHHPDYRHWLAGDVLTCIDQLENTLIQAGKRHQSHYKKQQDSMFSEKFEYRDTCSGRRAADAVIDFLSHNA